MTLSPDRAAAPSGGRAAFFFEVELWEGEPLNMEPDKCDDLAWFALDALPDRMVPYCREARYHILARRRFPLYGW